MAIKNYRFFNFPRKYDLRDYKDCINNIIKRYSRIKNIISIYEWGDTSNPGISDIDILFILKKGTDNALPISIRSFHFTDNKTKYLVAHPFIFIGEESFKDIRYIYKKTDFKLLHGKGIKIKNLTKNESYYAGISLLNDIIIRHYPRDFIVQSTNRNINVRDTLLRLNSLKYSVSILKSLTKENKKSWNKTIDDIRKLRSSWFMSRDSDSLASLNNEAIRISMEITDSLRKFLLKRNLVKIFSGKTVKYSGIKNKTLFVKDWNKEKAVQDMYSMAKSKKRFSSILPIELSAQLVEYSKQRGKISSYIRKNISGDVSYQLKHKKVIERRINILNNQATLAYGLKHSDFVAFFDFGYRNISGINNLILSLLDKVRF